MAIDQAQSQATIEAVPATPQTRPDTSTKPQRLPPYAVVLLNDSQHTCTYVVEVLRGVFGYSRARAYLLMMKAHLTGRSIVWTGSFEVAEFKRDRIRSFGPDTYAMHSVSGPLGCLLEPLPV